MPPRETLCGHGCLPQSETTSERTTMPPQPKARQVSGRREARALQPSSVTKTANLPPADSRCRSLDSPAVPVSAIVRRMTRHVASQRPSRRSSPLRPPGATRWAAGRPRHGRGRPPATFGYDGHLPTATCGTPTTGRGSTSGPSRSPLPPSWPGRSAGATRGLEVANVAGARPAGHAHRRTSTSSRRGFPTSTSRAERPAGSVRPDRRRSAPSSTSASTRRSRTRTSPPGRSRS